MAPFSSKSDKYTPCWFTGSPPASTVDPPVDTEAEAADANSESETTSEKKDDDNVVDADYEEVEDKK